MSARFAQCASCSKYVPIGSKFCMHCGGDVIAIWGVSSGPADFSKMQGEAQQHRIHVLESGIQVALQYLNIDNCKEQGINLAKERLERVLGGRF